MTQNPQQFNTQQVKMITYLSCSTKQNASWFCDVRKSSWLTITCPRTNNHINQSNTGQLYDIINNCHRPIFQTTRQRLSKGREEEQKKPTQFDACLLLCGDSCISQHVDTRLPLN
ncbi:hypothetical protein AAFF_G00368110 [Aldrovandia affinis]|uniref:Uncharacterized protein n=1 Tax=Aldrovandia affinis TaxID=143900 RepID=A0AAD7VZM0_9TELE|nr:hypothetical protein AAFF_G00368110 [Aldrovandia affinis]